MTRTERAVERLFTILDRPIRVALTVALVGYCAAVMLSRWVRDKLRRRDGAG